MIAFTRCFNLPATRRALLLLTGLTLVTGFPSAAGIVCGFDGPQQDSLESDYASELPRTAPLSPSDATGSFSVAPGFKIEQIAAEPLLTDPVAVAFDEHYWMYVVEMRGYSENDEDHLGQIRLLKDTNQDGLYDTSQVFADGLSWPTAITCYGGGIFVGAAPDILYLKDTDGDDIADERRVVYTGFGRSNVQGLINTFKWGLDNRVHGATSSSGARLEFDGTDSSNSEATLNLKGRDFAFNPRTGEIGATSGGAQHGLTFNPWGEKFVCSNSDHIQFVTFEDRYIARNPFLNAGGARISIAMDGPQADVFRESPVEPWRIVRTRLRKKGIVPGPVEGGGTAAGYFTGATGITIYRGNAWPERFYGWAMIGDVGSNLIHRKELTPSGLVYDARRVDANSEFVTSSDIWFRPVQFANAPDGSLVVLDMYREVIEHPKSLHPVIKQHLDLTSGRDRGRIYRIVPEGFRHPELPDLSHPSLKQLVKTLTHKNGWHRETAARLIFERQDPKGVPLLTRQLESATDAEDIIWTLAALSGLDAINTSHLAVALNQPHPMVRVHAIRLAESIADRSPELRERLFRMADDQDIKVRYQLAFTLGEIKDPRRYDALASIIAKDHENRYSQLAVHSSLSDGAGILFAKLCRNKRFSESAASRAFIVDLARQIIRQQSQHEIASFLESLAWLATHRPGDLKPIIAGLEVKPGSDLQKQIDAATSGLADQLLDEMIQKSIADVTRDDLSIDERVESIRTLRLARSAEVLDRLAALLGPSEAPEIQSAAIETIGSFADDQVPVMLLSRWKQLSPRAQSQALNTLYSRGESIRYLLSQMEAGKFPLAAIDSNQRYPLLHHADPEIRRRAESVLLDASLGTRETIVEQYRTALELKGDSLAGQQIFNKSCSKCHQINGIGFLIGPNLAAMQNRGAEAILLNILAPNQEVNPQYTNYVVQTVDGRVFSGMIADESATAITLTPGEDISHSILRIDIEQIQNTGQSLMPEGLESEISVQQMADLLAYLSKLP